MKLSRASFLDTIEHLCNNPKNHLSKNGTFWEILAIIQGMALGSGVHGLNGSHAGIQDFFHWLEKKVGIHSSFNWFSIESFHAMYPDDETTLKDFARYYREFCEELPDEEDDIQIKISESKANELLAVIGQNESFKTLRQEIQNELWRNSNNRKYLISKENNNE